MYGDADRVCPMDTVEWMMSTIGHMVYGNYQFGGYNHADFGKANDQVFMSELHEALSHLQPHEGHITQEEEFEEDLGRALEEEYAHAHAVEMVHEGELAVAHDLGLHDVVVAPLVQDVYHSSTWEEPSWRDDHYHDHAGFDLTTTHHTYEVDHRGMRYEPVVNQVQEKGVEHYVNESYHQNYGQTTKNPYGQFLQ